MTDLKLELSTPSDREIRLERVFNASRDRVWQALTEPALVAQWWGRGNPVDVQRLELEVGGYWRFVEHTEAGSHTFGGRIRLLEPPERIVQTFEWEGMPGYIAVTTMTLEALGPERTRMVSVSLFHSVEERDGMLHSGMSEGTEQSYQALDRLLAQPKASWERAAAAPRVHKIAFSMYPVTDITRARVFYEQTLGLRPGLNGGQGGKFWVEYDLPGGGCLALTNATGDEPSSGAGGTVALEVSDLAGLIAQLKERGVSFKSDVIRGPRCQMAVCLDPEGNSLLLHQLDGPVR